MCHRSRVVNMHGTNVVQCGSHGNLNVAKEMVCMCMYVVMRRVIVRVHVTLPCHTYTSTETFHQIATQCAITCIHV